MNRVIDLTPHLHIDGSPHLKAVCAENCAATKKPGVFAAITAAIESAVSILIGGAFLLAVAAFLSVIL
ncbi:MAG: hypothetical protein LBM28_00845 [Oscillospiraceae bacterium]|jgi:hypothetical protein|nr:hypothetical protein [Oscillospiraceae bacterium]